jgi:putative FmdB family regulatory protein
MPIYEYQCADCRRAVSLLVMRISDPTPPSCPRCGGAQLRRLMSRFATIRSEEDRLDALADPSSLGDLNEDDPQSVARWMKKMGGEMGEDMGDDVEEALEAETSGDLGAGSEAAGEAAGGGGDDL